MKSVVNGFVRLTSNIYNGFTLFGKKPAGAASFSLDLGSIVALLLVFLVVESAIAFAFLHPTAMFSVWGLHSFALFTCSLLTITWLLVAFTKTQWQFGRILTMWISGLICILIPVKIFSSLAEYIQLPTLVGLLFVLFVISLNTILLYRVSRRGLYHTRLTSGVLSVAATVLFVGFNALVPNVDLWVYDWRSETYDSQPEKEYLNTEDVYYKQAELMDAASDNIGLQVDGVKDLFFLGFAGEGDNVFKNEVLSVQAIVSEKLHVADRSAVLINNSDTVDQLPIASGHNFRDMLGNISEKMNLEEDVLMLYLTSHGSRDHQLSVELDYLELNNLAAADLAAAIEETAIKWKVIILSACYSGGFIEHLKDDHTVVITAARHDRTSFGCQSENDYTYFGNAYFNEAIAAGNNILDSFTAAEASISLRESAEGLTPSEPQIFIGSKVNNYFDDFTQGLPFATYNDGDY